MARFLLDFLHLEGIMRALMMLVVLWLVFTNVVATAAQKDDKAKKEKAQPADPAAEALYPQPTEAHKEMTKADEGVWDAVMKAYFAGPNQPPQEFKGIETVRAAVDGLFLISDFEADFVGGKKFRGHGISGYDPRKKKIVGVWADNMSPTLGTLEGDYEPKSKSITMWFTHPDPMTGEMRKDKHVAETKGDGHKLYTIYMSAPGGGDQQVKVLEIESKRRKESGETKAAETKADGESKKSQ